MSELRQPTTLLTLGRLPVSLELARTLQAGGMRVIVADPYAWPLARLSRAVSRCYRVSAPASDADGWLADIASIVEREQVERVIPVSEEILYVARLREAVPGSCQVQCMPLDALLTLHDKWRFVQFARQLGVPVPLTRLADRSQVVAEVGDAGFVIKPRLSCSGTGVSLHAHGGWPADQPKGTDRIVQQRLAGAACCTLTFARGGKVVHSVAYRSLVDFGSVSVCFERMPVPDVVRDGIEAIVTSLQYDGLVGFDALADASGQWHVIECNPRATSGLHLFPPDVLMAVCSVRHSLPDAASTARRDARTNSRQEFWSSLSVFFGKVFTGRFDASHLRLLLRTPDITWRWRDPGPFLCSSIVLMPQLLRALRERRPVVQLLTEDIGYYRQPGVDDPVRPLDMTIGIDTEASAAWLAFAATVTFGASGERYRRLHLSRQLQRFASPVFLSVRRGQTLLGIYALDRRHLRIADRSVTGIYRALFAVREDCRGQGVGTALAARAMDWIDAEARAAGAPVLSYGCIAADNAASLSVLAAQGGQALGSLTSRLLYRQWPRASVRLVELPAGPGPSVDPVSAIDVTPCNLPRYGFVDDDVRISARVGTSAIAMADVGRGAALALRLLVRPWRFMRQRFDPESLAYLRISDLQIRPDCADDAQAFVEALLVRFGVNYALLVLNSESSLEAELAQAGLFDSGIGRHFLPPPQRLQIIGRWHGGGRLPDARLDQQGEYRLMPVDL